jgi:hypothetical protein
VAVIMKSTKRTLPRGTSYDECAIALAIRLGIRKGPPAHPFSQDQWKNIWAVIGMNRAHRAYSRPVPQIG